MDRAQTRALVAKARSQHGLLAQRDLPAGATLAELVRDGLWQDVLPGVVGAASVEVTREMRESATMLWRGKVVLSHFSAARRAGIWVPDDPRAWISVAFDSRRRDLPGLKVVRTRQLFAKVVRDGIHQWTPARRTIVDLAPYLTRKQLEAVLLSAVRLGETSVADVAAAAVGLERRRGMADLWQVLGLWSPERETMLEGRLLEDVRAVVDRGVQGQHWVTSPDGTQRARLDVAIPELRLAFEADGLYYHSTDEQLAADQARDRWLAALGWLTIRFREGALDDRAAVRAEIASIVARRHLDLAA